ncbi:hypothetical protein LINPERPRIM_LOCUS17012 [Linum perenne]
MHQHHQRNEKLIKEELKFGLLKRRLQMRDMVIRWEKSHCNLG